MTNLTSGIPSAVVLPSFDNTLGAILVGGLACAVMYGVTSIQTFWFFQQTERNPLMKLFVGCLWVLDTFDFFLTSHILYWYLVVNYVNPAAIANIVWSLLLHATVTSVTDFSIRMMFARRIWNLSYGNLYLTAIIVAISLVDLVCGMVITVKGFQIGGYAGLESIKSVMYLNFAAGFSSDLFVALTLSYFLWKSKTGFKRTDSLVHVLMVYTINTGLLTALDASAGLICFIAMPDNYIFFSFYLLLSKLYINSYLASLNARDSLRETLRSNDLISIHLSDVPGPLSSRSANGRLARHSISLQQSRHTQSQQQHVLPVLDMNGGTVTGTQSQKSPLDPETPLSTKEWRESDYLHQGRAL